ncbi:MAG: BamA/TamA family outer membrane protein [Adhaeribacter sp.]
MLKKRLLWWLLSLPLLGYLSSCSGTGKLKEGQRLYTGAKVKIESPYPVSNEAELTTILESVITPQPNKSFLGMRPGVAFYNMGSDKGIGKFIRKTLGEEPVFYDSVNNTSVSELIVNRLHNNGYFTSTVSYKADVKPKTAAVTYTAHVTKPYTIAKIDFPAGDSVDQVYRDMAATQAQSLLKVGDRYNLGTLTAERVRIDAEMKNKGYFYFNPEYLLWKVDTTQNNYTLDVYLRVKPDAPDKALTSYKLDDIYIYTDFILGPDSIPQKPPVRVGGYHYYPDEESLKAKHLLQSVFLVKDSTYSRTDHALTLSRLMGLGIFRFVDIQFRPNDTLSDRLNTYMRLTPSQLHSVRAELEATTQTNGFAGPGFNVNYRHRNLMRGAEQLLLNFSIAQQTYSARSNRNETTTDPANADKGGLNSFEFGVRAELNVPRFLTPFRLKNLRSQFVPRTRFTLGYNLMSRPEYFVMNGYNFTYGYAWRPRRRVTHEITPVNVQYVRLSNQTEAFENLLADNLFLRQSFENQFILGSIYNFTYNTQTDPKQKTHFFFNGNLDLSGNVLNLFQSQVLRSKNDPQTIIQQPYSQYTRFTFDTRYYLGLTRKSQLATRMIIGLGFPYGNSVTLPYVKQYYIGGANSIRSYRPRELGPGTYRDTTQTGYFDQTGDIRFETNVEYRFDLIPYLKGALFVDAGNIWLSQAHPNKPGGEFQFSKALNQLAVGAGAGLRVDADFFVLRLDAGFPVRDPYVTPSYVLKLPPPRKSVIFHIAVGYPF